MKIRHPLIQKSASLVAAGTAALLSKTLDWRAAYVDPTVDPVHPRNTGRHIHLCWHENMFLPVTMRGSRRMLALISAHRDGVLIGHAVRHLGWNFTQGSTTRGGVAAVIRLLREGRSHICVAPDGPTGPRRTLALGSVFLASRLGVPVVCWGAGFDRPWRARSWDRFALPRPFSRARAVAGPAVYVPHDADRVVLERYREWLERLMNWLTDEAEAWAASGRRRAGEVVMVSRRASEAMHGAKPPVTTALPTDLADEWAQLPRANRRAAA